MPRLRGRTRSPVAGRAGRIVNARLLLDENRPERLIELRADVFPDTSHVRMFGLGGATDTKVWSTAADANRVLVARDEDFITSSVLRGAPPKVGWLNIGNTSNVRVEHLFRSHAATIESFATHPDATFRNVSGVESATTDRLSAPD